MRLVRNEIGGLGNLLFKQAYLWGQMRDGVIPDVYVQNYHYWEKYRDEMRMMFNHGIGETDRIALHIRRGDYLKVPEFHVNLWETDYYKEAVKLFPNEKFLVFCKDNQNDAQDADDREWCENNLPSLGIDFEMYEHGHEVDDLNAMASCKGIIMANSSFSWWSAFLGNPNKKVVCPKIWFGDGVERCKLIPEWTLL